MQRERKLERDDETLATVLASSESQARAFRKSVAGKEREGKKAKETRDRIWDEIWCGAQEEKERDRALQFGRRSWFFFFPLYLITARSALDCPYLLKMETRRESPVFSFFF
jgi:hypothetical protein